MELKDLMEKIKPFFALAILIMLIILTVNLVEHNKLQKEINENCGWTTEDYKCYCEYSDVINFIETELNVSNITNVQVFK